ncbi:hypothetical protein Cgig2_007645 [Carnegiea gigantea]|uniref:Transposase-associated domain-containing protein n=1 Tax=Carnegiea gigantea TaxID=171969 RepID=A0A9Q1JKI5_9CARY|nr:hypothetical protein Cgig2_007645 [Carnegiea gigantea]
MDTSWIELSNDHPDDLDGTVKFIKLAKENLVEGKTRCLCRRCKVDKWLPIEEVEQHILFKGFYKEYKHFIFHGKGDILDHMKHRGSTSRETNNDLPNFIGQDDVEGLLRAAFGVNIPGSRDDTVYDAVDKSLDEGVEPFYMYDDHAENSDVSMPEGELRKALACSLNPVAKSLKTQLLTHPSSSTTIAQPKSDLKPPTQPTLSLRASDSVPQRPITSLTSEQASKRPSIKDAEPTAALLTRSTEMAKPIVQQLVQPTPLNGASGISISDICPAIAYSLHWSITTQTDAHFPYCSSSTAPDSPIYCTILTFSAMLCH